MSLEFEISAIIPATPDEIYAAWLDSAAHAAMTGGAANVNNQVGGRFEAWNGYISGTNLELEPGKRIVQAWRTVEFSEEEEDSRLEITLEAADGGTKLILRHTNVPPDGAGYEQGWFDNYFEPMKAYFSA